MYTHMYIYIYICREAPPHQDLRPTTNYNLCDVAATWRRLSVAYTCLYVLNAYTCCSCLCGYPKYLFSHSDATGIFIAFAQAVDRRKTHMS